MGVGWTPLFPKAGAVISESGGMLSHCAIVAREYGIPSIVSALGVMNIKDGQMVTVDAIAGILYLE
jgi:pyruvate,water dikinase